MLDTSADFEAFIFTHIPKCAGTSFRQLLNESAHGSKVLKKSIYIPGENGLKTNRNLSQLNLLERWLFKKKSLKVIGMHTHYGVHKEYTRLKEPFYFTLLREPIERVLSHYYFFNYKLGYNDCKGIHINDLPEEKLDFVLGRLSNVMVKFLVNKQLANFNEVTTKDLLKAKFNLENNYACFGIVEHMEKSLELLKVQSPHWLKIKGSVPRNNTNKRKESKGLDERLHAIVKRYNNYDIDLYNFAIQVFEKKVKKYLPSDIT